MKLKHMLYAGSLALLLLVISNVYLSTMVTALQIENNDYNNKIVETTNKLEVISSSTTPSLTDIMESDVELSSNYEVITVRSERIASR